jgi:hypothetical protein
VQVRVGEQATRGGEGIANGRVKEGPKGSKGKRGQVGSCKSVKDWACDQAQSHRGCVTVLLMLPPARMELGGGVCVLLRRYV